MLQRRKKPLSTARKLAIAKARSHTGRCRLCGGFTPKSKSTCLKCRIANAKTPAEAARLFAKMRAA